MICELCGRNFTGGVRLSVEGSVVNACEGCSRYGKVVSVIATVKEKPKPVAEGKTRVYEMQDLESEVMLVEDYGLKVKDARERKKLKQGDLARLINEPESLVHRLETGGFEPDEALIGKLERTLGIKLRVKVEDVPRIVGRQAGGEVTLGDVVVIRKKRGAG
jgi:putative transcription factor